MAISTKTSRFQQLLADSTKAAQDPFHVTPPHLRRKPRPTPTVESTTATMSFGEAPRPKEYESSVADAFFTPKRYSLPSDAVGAATVGSPFGHRTDDTTGTITGSAPDFVIRHTPSGISTFAKQFLHVESAVSDVVQAEASAPPDSENKEGWGTW